MKKLLLTLSAALFLFAACEHPGSSNLPETKPTITAKNLPEKVLFAEINSDADFKAFLDQKGVSSTNELGEFVNKRIQKDYPGVKITAFDPMAGCSAFIAPSKEGGFYAGRNFDFQAEMVPNVMIIRNKPKNGDYASVSTFNLGFVNFNFPNGMSDSDKNKIIARTGVFVPLDGVNEKGLVVAVLNQENTGSPNLTNETTEKPDLTITSCVRLLLNKAATVEEAKKLIKNYDLHSDIYTAHHLFVADATGKAAAFEWDNLNSNASKKGLRITDTNCVTNHPLYKYTDGVSEETLKSGYGNSVERYNTLKTNLASGKKLTFAEAKELLHKVHQGTHSRWSIVYHLTPDYSEETYWWEVSVTENWKSNGYKFSVK
ncbi:MAG: linear amide C-N hydrolase [Treponema sp.]|nr:linear amide C-N hydrolase [Treponema sp.]